MFEEEPVSLDMEDVWAKKVELPEFSGTDPVGWISKAERFFEKRGIHTSDKLQWAFMSMEGVAMLWFYFWSQEDPDQSWEAYSMALIRRFEAQKEFSVEKMMLVNTETEPESWKGKEMRDEPVLEVVEMTIDFGEEAHHKKLESETKKVVDAVVVEKRSEKMGNKERSMEEGVVVDPPPPPEPPDADLLVAAKALHIAQSPIHVWRLGVAVEEVPKTQIPVCGMIGGGDDGRCEGGGRGHEVANMVGGERVPPPEPLDLDASMEEDGSLSTAERGSSSGLVELSPPEPPDPPDPCPRAAVLGTLAVHELEEGAATKSIVNGKHKEGGAGRELQKLGPDFDLLGLAQIGYIKGNYDEGRLRSILRLKTETLDQAQFNRDQKFNCDKGYYFLDLLGQTQFSFSTQWVSPTWEAHKHLDKVYLMYDQTREKCVSVGRGTELLLLHLKSQMVSDLFLVNKAAKIFYFLAKTATKNRAFSFWTHGLISLDPIQNPFYLSAGTATALIRIGGETMKLFFHIVCGPTCTSNPLTPIEWYIIFTSLPIVLSQLPNFNSIAWLSWVSLIGAVTAITYFIMVWVLSVSQQRPPSISYEHLLREVSRIWAEIKQTSSLKNAPTDTGQSPMYSSNEGHDMHRLPWVNSSPEFDHLSSEVPQHKRTGVSERENGLIHSASLIIDNSRRSSSRSEVLDHHNVRASVENQLSVGKILHDWISEDAVRTQDAYYCEFGLGENNEVGCSVDEAMRMHQEEHDLMNIIVTYKNHSFNGYPQAPFDMNSSERMILNQEKITEPTDYNVITAHLDHDNSSEGFWSEQDIDGGSSSCNSSWWASSLKPHEVVLACRENKCNGRTMIEWLIPWKTHTVEEATWEEADFIKQLHSPFYLEGWEMAQLLKNRFLFSALRTRQKLKEPVLIGTRSL